MKMMGLDHLGPELMALVCEYVDDTSPSTTLSLALTNKYIHSVVMLVRHRHIDFSINQSSNFNGLTQKIEALSNDENIPAHVKSITVSGRFHTNLTTHLANRPNCWDSLSTFISRIGKLETLTWSVQGCNIPIGILQALDKFQSKASLQLFTHECFDDPQLPGELTKALARSSTLTHLRTVIKATSIHPDVRTFVFRYIVSRAPNIRYAGIVDRVGGIFAPGNPVIDQIKEAYRPAKKPTSSLRLLTLDGYNMSNITLDDWASIVDLGSLECVKFSRGALNTTYFQHAAAMLPALKQVSLNFRQLENMPPTQKASLASTAHQYLTTCSPLETLSIWSWKDILSVEDVTTRHGMTLRSLQLHEREAFAYSTPRQTLSPDELESIINVCPHLTELTFDLNRTASKMKLDQHDKLLPYYKILQKIGPKLKYLQIYFDVGSAYLYRVDGGEIEDEDDESDTENEYDDSMDVDGQENEDENKDQDIQDASGSTSNLARERGPFRPSTDRNMVAYIADIWRLIFGSSTAGVRRMDVKMGEWESGSATSRLGAPVENAYMRHYVVSPAVRDDEVDQCVIKTRSLTG